MNIRKAFARTLLCSLLLVCTTPLASHADMYRLNENGNFIYVGGVNKFDDETPDTYEETVALEAQLRENNYLNVAELPDDEFETFTAYSWWFTDYIRDDEYYKEMYQIYIYQPSYLDFMNQYSESGRIEDYTQLEIESSTVVISYAYWDSLAKAGTVDYEYNDAIPEGREAGYLQIVSPIDAEITFRFPISDRYFVFPLKADEPFLVRVKTGGYKVTEINGVEINREDDTLPYSNTISINDYNTPDEPYILELFDVVDKYDIQPYDSAITTVSAENVSEFHITVADDSSEDDEDASSNNKLAILIPILIIVLIVLVVYRKKKETSNNKN